MSKQMIRYRQIRKPVHVALLVTLVLQAKNVSRKNKQRLKTYRKLLKDKQRFH